MGLTGIIAEVTLRLWPIETSTMGVESERAPDLDATMALMDEGDSWYRSKDGGRRDIATKYGT